MKKFKLYVQRRNESFLKERLVKPISNFSEDEQITLAESGAGCFDGDRHPDLPWGIRQWLEDILCVQNHGVCTGCKAKEVCKQLSEPVTGG